MVANMTSSSPSERPRQRVIGNVEARNFWLFDPVDGYDLTHPATPTAPVVQPRLRLVTTRLPITIAPAKTALIIVDMQNFFLSPYLGRKPDLDGLAAQAVLLERVLPAAAAAGIQVVHVTWGMTDEDLPAVPPNLIRNFGDFETTSVIGDSPMSFGDDIGMIITFPDGTSVPAGRKLMLGEWNSDLHGPLKAAFVASQSSPLPHLRFHKIRHSAFSATSPLVHFLRSGAFTSLLFAGVQIDQCVLSCLEQANTLGFDTILVKDACGTGSPAHTRETAVYECSWSLGFATDSHAMEDGVRAMTLA